MKTLLLVVTSCFVLSNTIAAEQPLSLKPGRFLLVTSGDFFIPPMMVDVSNTNKGTFEMFSEGTPKISAEITQDGGSYVFSMTIPGKGEVPPSGQDWPKNYYMTYAGYVPTVPYVGLQGVCSTTFTYYHSGSAAESQHGTFVLYSTDQSTSKTPTNP